MRVGRSLSDRESNPEKCPFCPGHEADVATFLDERPALTSDDPWSTRVCLNKYPAASSDAAGEESQGHILRSRPARGHHEVIIETPHHERDLGDMRPEEVLAVLETYRRRVREVRQTRPDLFPVLFKNQGPKAGASLRHPHAQLLAVPLVPPDVRHRERRMRHYHRRTGKCLVCRVLDRERTSGRRVVVANEHYTAFVPFAAAVPFETRIVPHRHVADLPQCTEDELRSLAGVLTALVWAVRSEAGEPDFNLLFFLPSNDHRGDDAAHWYMSLRPRYGSDAGFERATGMYINTTWPEDNAALLRGGLRSLDAAA